MYNHIGLMGRLTADPELRYTTNGVAVATFTLASDRGRKRDDGSKATDFINVVAWRARAEFAAQYLTKGRLVVVEGRLESRTYTANDGSNRKAVEINASAIHFAEGKRDGAAAPPSGSAFDGFTEVDADDDMPF